VGVFPDIKKAAFVVGGEWGRGVFTCRQPDGTMGAPAFFTIGGGSVGWQWGGQSADLVLLIMNKNGVKYLLEDNFTLGGEAAAVAGPVGRSAKAATDAQLHAQILSWSRSKGLFLGAALAGHVVKPDKSQNEKAYGKPVSAREILVEHKMTTPDVATGFVNTTTEYTRRES
jgi:lipid-binding SYLF domain-containing protein